MKRSTAWALALALFAVGLYAPNWNDYFIGDDFDLIHSFYGKPLGYFPALLWSNESGDVWKSLGIDATFGHGYLRPLKIWLLALDSAIWGANPLGFHLHSSAFFTWTVLLLFWILRRALPERPLLAAAGAGSVALHPVFAEVVPFITTREEVAATAFGLASFLSFVRSREDGRSLVPFHLCYALALLTKESAIIYLALPVAWDLAHGRIRPRSPAAVLALARTYAPSVAILAVYFALRRVAFGNFIGGDGTATNYLSPEAFLAFHGRFWRSLADPTLFAPAGVRGAAAVAAGAGVLLVVATLFCLRRVSDRRRRDLLVYGPLWYLASTAILHGTYFAVRHNALPLIGILLFATLAVDTLLSGGLLRGPRRCALGVATLSAALFLPPTIASSREWRATAAGVAAMRAAIEEQTAGLPRGCVVSLSGVPQWILPPFFFGWGLRSALQRPFTASDLARVCTVIDARNLELMQEPLLIPPRYDAVIELDPSPWVTPALEQRHRLRLWREGIVPRGNWTIP